MADLKLITFEDCYDMAVYANENWKGNFTAKEIAENAYNYLCDIQEAKEKNEPNRTVTSLLNNMDEDDTTESNYYAMMIRREMGWLHPIKYMCRKCKYYDICGDPYRTKNCKLRESEN
nr:MAG TPA: hypothetical protein [Caudoviricetes sp.]